MKGVQLTKLVQELGLHNLTPEIDLSEIVIKTAEINRPALQLTGYLEHFANERVQIIGYVEYTYLMQLSDEERKFKYERFISSKIPCVIFSTMTRPSQDMIDLAVKYNVPTFVTERTTSSFMAEIIRWLGVQLAPCISIHGVLVDVYGEGVLITGESGIGKSEAALELIKRGHRLVSDDVVELRKVSDVTLVGSAPDITRHFIELRGIGIIDVKTLLRALRIHSLWIWLSNWKSGTETKNMTVSACMRNIQSILEIRLYAILCLSVRDVIWLLSLNLRQLTTDRRRWDTMQRKSCTNVFRQTLQRNVKKNNLK